MATAAARNGGRAVKKLADMLPSNVLQDIKYLSKKKQKGVSLKYMMDFGQNPMSRQLLLSAQFLQEELPTRLAHRVMELEGEKPLRSPPLTPARSPSHPPTTTTRERARARASARSSSSSPFSSLLSDASSSSFLQVCRSASHISLRC